jgi:hypothetical protein
VVLEGPLIRTIISELPKRRNFIRGRYTIAIGYPWLTYGAIMQLELLANPEWNVLELGSGGSTIFFSRRFKSVKSLDFHPEWSSKVKAALPENSNVTLHVGEIEELSNIIKAEPDGYYDILLVDIGRHDRYRRALGQEAVSKLRIGGYLVVDNYRTPQMDAFDYTGFDKWDFDDLNWGGKGTRICIKRGVGAPQESYLRGRYA